MPKDLDEEKRIRVEELASQLELFFQFCVQLIPYMDLLKEAANSLEERESFAVNAAVIIEAVGGDYAKEEFEARSRKERAEAVYNLLEVLQRTENEKIDFRKGEIKKATILNKLGFGKFI